MTIKDKREAVLGIIEANGASSVAKKIGYSNPVISRIKKGDYPNPEPIYDMILGNFTAETLVCPVVGEMPISRCLEARRRSELPYFPSSRQSTDLYHTCPLCPNNPKRGGRS
jgi:hypothetical protein